MINGDFRPGVGTGAIQPKYDSYFVEALERWPARNREIQGLARRRGLGVNVPRAGRFDDHTAERLRRSAGQACVNQDELQGDGFGITIGVADSDLNTAAAVQVDQIAEVIVGLD